MTLTRHGGCGDLRRAMTDGPLPSQLATAQVLGHGLEIQRVPGCHELRLWLLRGDVDLNAQCHTLLDAPTLPFWAFCWGAGQALARYLLDHPSEVAGKRVVDFGAGSGIAGIAAARAGAAHVVAVDSDPRARQVARVNAELNGVQLDTAERVPEAWDILLAADVLYETGNCQWVTQMAAPERVVFVSDPVRDGTPRPPWEPLAIVEARTFPDVDYPRCSARLYRLEGSPRVHR